MTTKSPANIAEYIQAAPQEGHAHLRRLYALLQSIAPEAEETMKWRMPFFVEPRFLFAFSAHKAHLNFTPMAAGLEPFQDELTAYQTTKGMLQVPYDEPLPEDLIRRIAEHRVQTVRATKDDAFWPSDPATSQASSATANKPTPNARKTKRNPEVDAYFDKAKMWQEELRRLRTILLDSPLTEALKWGKPCYAFEGGNVVILIPFKESCGLLFCKGALLKDPEGILIQPTENTQGARQMRFTGVREITETEPVLRAYLREAVDVEKAGLEVKYKPTSEFAVPAELADMLRESPALKTAFDALTPGRQRGYLLHFAAAKQSRTRTTRIEKWTPHILAGKGMHDE